MGSTATLQCNVVLLQFTGYSSIPITVTVALLKGYTPVMTDLASVNSPVHTTAFNISDVGVANAGQYRCRATVRTNQNYVIDSSLGVSSTANIYIKSKYSNTIFLYIYSVNTLKILIFCFLSTTTTATINWRYHTLSGFYCYPTVQCGSTAVHRLLIYTNHCHCRTTQGIYTSHDRISYCA